MMFSRENYAKYFCLFAIVLMQLSVTHAVIKCIQCGSSGKCSTNLAETVTDCNDDKHTKCFTEIDTSGNIVRGCKTVEEANTCTAQNNCILTEAEKNNQLICKKCDGTDEKCSQTDMTANDLKYNQICDASVKKCIKKVDNKLVVRGCASDSDVTQCTDANTCETCDSVNCNTGIFPTKRINCYQCTGSNCTDVKANSIVSKPCTNYENKDQCYTIGKNETDMTRGCKSDIKDNQCTSNVEGCAFCSEDNCNYFKYKYDQELKCHQCSSSDETNECFKQQTAQDFKNCEKQLLYNASQYCYTQLTEDTIKRGCLHDNAELTLDTCKDGDSATCNKCNNTNGCNSKAETLEFTCIICRSDLNEKCWNNADTLTGQKCRTRNSTTTEGCFHGIWDGVAIRGCMVDATVQNQAVCKDLNKRQCNACYKKNCNTGKSTAAAKVGVQFPLLLIVLTTLWNFK